LEVDRSRILADGSDAAVFTVRAVDAAARAVPTANQTICFTIEGAGRIIGVGNGDPSSLEPDCFRETVELVELSAAKSMILGEGVMRAELEPDFDDSSWPSLVDARSGSREPPAARVIRGILELNEMPTCDGAKLLMRWFGENQHVYLNGRSVAAFSRADCSGLPEVELLREQLHIGRNLIAIIASAYRDATRREHDERVRPAVLRIDRPAPEWRRSLFNGLAQVIVQSNGIAGELVLEARACGLVTARASVVALGA
jgi:beta-galactosidase